MTSTEQLLSALLEAGASEDAAQLLYRLITRHYVGDVIHHTNRHAPARSPLAEREEALQQQDALPLISRMLSRPDRAADYDRQLDAILSLLTPEPEPG